MGTNEQPWGYMRGDQFIPLPKQPMLLAGLGPPPFDVELPTGKVRHVIEQPVGSSGKEAQA